MSQKISIIIITYRVERYLQKCLDSVLGQDYENLEIIMVIGRSPHGDDDGCEDIARGYAALDERIKIITCEAAGVSDARNRGLEAATGELIGFVDSDDFIDRDMYSRMVRQLSENDADIVVCGRYYEFVNTTKKDAAGRGCLMSGRDALETVLKGDGFYLHCWDKLYRRELWEGISFPVDRYVEDRVVVNRVLGRAQRIYYDPTPAYHYRERKESMSKTGSIAYNNTLADEELAAYIGSEFPDLKPLLEKYMIYGYITAIQNVYMSGGGKKEAAPFTQKLKAAGISPGNRYVGASLKLKRFLALNAPGILVWNTRRKNNTLENEEERFT
ncbi:MAG: glycosyltransferase family 2 protein [Lachnospiraceae bacterium]|nr:glycosyltransferase family 2 protein [Lachnospiraceae bacterium]